MNGLFSDALAADLYKGTPLNLFRDPPIKSEGPVPPVLSTWDELQNKEFKLALTRAPENIFQEMIMWTEQGKLWKFPIDNEQGTITL